FRLALAHANTRITKACLENGGFVDLGSFSAQNAIDEFEGNPSLNTTKITIDGNTTTAYLDRIEATLHIEQNPRFPLLVDTDITF
ncbi:MAG: hypothetical protein WC651_04180, partial [Candidatus Gracilibacteria bacterium]